MKKADESNPLTNIQTANSNSCAEVITNLNIYPLTVKIRYFKLLVKIIFVCYFSDVLSIINLQQKSLKQQYFIAERISARL